MTPLSELLDTYRVASQTEREKGYYLRRRARHLLGLLDGARCHVQIDLDCCDAVTPGPEDVHYP